MHRERDRAPGKKNTRRWCRGKVGREHVEGYALSSWANGRKICEARPEWSYGIPWYDRHRGEWWCYHNVICTECGKILRSLPPEDCPERPA